MSASDPLRHPRDPSAGQNAARGDGKPVSVIIPTHNRRDVVVMSVAALERQTARDAFEVIAVVDGDTDGSAAALRSLRTPFPLRVVCQANQGAAAARNRGAELATGELLLFLDDDMEAHPRLVDEHLGSHRTGREMVVGHIPLHPDSPQGILRAGVETWADERLARLAREGAEPGLEDLLTGQLSITRSAFRAIGGFDATFTEGGRFGNEDLDFGCRVQRAGLRVVFNPEAVSWQRYVVAPREYLRQRYDVGLADVLFARKHPARSARLFSANGGDCWRSRFVCRYATAAPVLGAPLTRALAAIATNIVTRGSSGYLARRLFRVAVKASYWRGVHDAGGLPQFVAPRILAYHAIRELSPSSPIAPYAVPPALFAAQLDALLGAGFTFITGRLLMDFLNRRAVLPSHSVLLTFDDCYDDLLEHALPLLVERSIPAIAFAVGGQIGGVNTWDRHLGVETLRLLDAGGLRTVAAGGVEIGAHSQSHCMLPRLDDLALREEVLGSLEAIEKAGLPRPRFFSYPYGESGGRVRHEVAASGVSAAFTIAPGPLRMTTDRFRLPRIEIRATDGAAEFAHKVAASSTGMFGLPTALSLEQDIARAWPACAG